MTSARTARSAAVLTVAFVILSAAPVTAAPESPRDEPWAFAATALALVPRRASAEASPAPCQPDVAAAPGSRDGHREAAFAADFPRQAAAVAGPKRWAVLIGVNDYDHGTSDTVGSVPDALMLCDILLSLGWRRDHILVLADSVATRERVVAAINWLARKADEGSMAVFSFSGHMRHRGVDRVEAGLWLADNAFIWRLELGRLLSRVGADRMWVTLQGCHSAGLSTPRLEGDGRVVTYSSRAEEKSFDDLSVGYSVQGRYLFVQGLRQADADRDGDGRVSVQEAYRWLRPRAIRRTSGRQHPVIVDRLDEPFLLGAP